MYKGDKEMEETGEPKNVDHVSLKDADIFIACATTPGVCCFPIQWSSLYIIDISLFIEIGIA